MKLAEALQERADLNRKTEELRRRLTNAILTQEGEEPTENPEELIRELDEVVLRLQKLVAAINKTNCMTRAGEETLTEIIAKKDAEIIRMSILRDLVETAGQSTYRARGAEIRILPTIKPAVLQQQVDRMAKEIRRLDNLLQETNWKTELLL